MMMRSNIYPSIRLSICLAPLSVLSVLSVFIRGSEGNLAACYEHCRPTHFHFLDIARRALHVKIDAARAMNKIALLDHKLITAVLRFDIQRAVMNEIPAERATRAAGRRIFRNVIGRRKETCVRARRADLDRLARERVTTGRFVTLI